MAKDVSTDRVVEAARGLDKAEFSRDDLAAELGVKKSQLKDGVKQARQEGLLEKIGEDDEGAGIFSLSA